MKRGRDEQDHHRVPHIPAAGLNYDWPVLARPDQVPPDKDWLIWLLLGGRGAGKTRAGAEWVRAQVEAGAKHIALIGASYADARDVMLDGQSGLLKIGYPASRPRFEVTRRKLHWPNGAVGYLFSGQDPDGLRGYQFDCAWADEFCAWDHADAALSNLRLALRLGEFPQLCMTTTPKPSIALRALLKTPGVVVSRSSTKDNRANLAPAFYNHMVEAYQGTRLGRQELEGEILLDEQGALWNRAGLEECFCDTVPELDKIIVAIDPPVTSGARADSCGIVVAGRVGEGRNAKVYILQDATVQGLSPERWATRVAEVWAAQDADYVLAEVNQGGELVTSVLSTVNPEIPVRTVYASKGKTARAEPVAALYEQQRVKHVGVFSDLEDELCRMGAKTKLRSSPDRADALVWAVTELLLKDRPEPKIRTL